MSTSGNISKVQDYVQAKLRHLFSGVARIRSDEFAPKALLNNVCELFATTKQLFENGLRDVTTDSGRSERSAAPKWKPHHHISRTSTFKGIRLITWCNASNGLRNTESLVMYSLQNCFFCGTVFSIAWSATELTKL